MVVFWKEDSGHQPRLITPENERGDETNYQSPPNFTFFDDPDVPFGPSGRPAPPEFYEPPGSPGLTPGWPPATSPSGGRERVGTGNTSRERLHPRPSPPEPQLIPIPMSDGEDDQPPEVKRQRELSRSRERVHSHVQVPQVPQIQPMVTPEPDDVSDGDFTHMNPSSPSAGPPPSAEQRGRSRRDERSRSRERVPPHSSSHDRKQPVVSPSRVQQTQTLATQGSDEDSATVDPQNRVSDRSRSSQEQGDSRRQGPQKQKGKKTAAENQPSESLKVTKHKFMDSDEYDEETQNEPGTSSTSQPTEPVLPLHQGPAASSQGPTVLDNSADEESEYSDEYSAQSLVSERTLYYPDLYVLTDEHGTMTPETHKYAAAPGSFCFVTTENGHQQNICNLITMPRVQRSLYLDERTNKFGIMKVEVPNGVDGQTRDKLERCMATCGRIKN